jgi:hypothetical protein
MMMQNLALVLVGMMIPKSPYISLACRLAIDELEKHFHQPTPFPIIKVPSQHELSTVEST